MKKNLFFTLSIVLFSINSLVARTIDAGTAKTVAVNYFNHQAARNAAHFDASSFNLVFTEESITNLPIYYVFNVGDHQGFIIISGDDDALPVLGYSTEVGYDPAKVNITFDKWMNNYKLAILFIIEHEIRADETIQAAWEKLRTNQFAQTEDNSAVPALCATKWDQSPYVNDACPLDADANKRCVTGCPATAMAQIMKYWNHPVQGTGFHSYQHPKYGTLSANFGNTTYDWASMPDVVDEANPAVAKLMADCGVAVNMQYTAESSGAYVIANSPTPKACSEYAYKTYFGYAAEYIQGLERENYTDSEWLAILKGELDGGRPMQYAGFGGGGHTFVCDGYDDNNMFHMNWGWGGQEDGYFLINALNPGAGGIGSGEGTYNNYQQAVIGIYPSVAFTSAAPKYGLAVNSAIEVSQAPIISGTPLTVDVDITFNGTADYVTDLAAIMFTEDGVFVDYIESKSNITFVDGVSQTFSFASDGVGGIPGKHIIGIYSALETDSVWSLVKQSTFTNPLTVTLSGDPNTLKISAAITISNAPLHPNEAFTVIGSVVNTGNEVFNGNIVADVFTSSGDYVLTLEEKEGLTIQPGASLSDIIFSSDGLDLEPGSYFIAWFNSSDLISYPIISNDFEDNPISFDVVEVPVLPDVYESNNVLSNAYNAPLSFTGDVATFKSTGSNIHTGDDVDYYKLTLAGGYSYTITARAHDQYNSGDGNEYTEDVYFTYNTGNGQSEQIDDILVDDIVLNAGGNVYFKVSPYFVGFTGTYVLDLTINRTLITGTNSVANDNDIVVYPVPASNSVAIDLKNSNIKIEQIKIQNAYGQVVSYLSNAVNEVNTKNIDVSSLSNGMYFMVIEGNNQKFIKKLIVNR